MSRIEQRHGLVKVESIQSFAAADLHYKLVQADMYGLRWPIHEKKLGGYYRVSMEAVIGEEHVVLQVEAQTDANDFDLQLCKLTFVPRAGCT
jgi:hypothetical protein